VRPDLRAEADDETAAGRAGKIPAAIGERAKAIATLVCSSMRSVAVPAIANARNGSCLFSIEATPS